jgi:plastocyanin
LEVYVGGDPMKRLMYVIPLSSIAVLVFAAIAAAQPAVVPGETTTPAQTTTPAESATPAEGTTPAPNDTTTVEIRNNAFNPAQLNVAPGTTVTFVNNDNVPHTATSDNKLFDLEIPPGSSYPVVLEGEGTVPYHCELHPEMKGTIVVGDGSGAEGTTTENPTDDDPTQNMLQDMLEKML